jgi:hypothetical protein
MPYGLSIITDHDLRSGYFLLCLILSLLLLLLPRRIRMGVSMIEYMRRANVPLEISGRTLGPVTQEQFRVVVSMYVQSMLLEKLERLAHSEGRLRDKWEMGGRARALESAGDEMSKRLKTFLGLAEDDVYYIRTMAKGEATRLYGEEI